MRHSTLVRLVLIALLCGASLGVGASAGLAVDDTRSEISVTWIGNGTARFRTTNSSWSPDGKISCYRRAELTTGSCSAKYQVTVSQTIYYRIDADPGSRFCQNAHPPSECVETVWKDHFDLGFNQDVPFTPKAVLENPQLLTITRSGTGSGTVASSPIGVDCGTDCDGEFPYGYPLILVQTPDSGSVFVGWTSSCLQSSTTCEFAQFQATTVDARFDLIVAPTPTPNLTAPPPTVAPTPTTAGSTVAPTTPAETAGDALPTEPLLGETATIVPTAGPVALGGSDATGQPDPATGDVGGPGAGDDDAAAYGSFFAGIVAGGVVVLAVIVGVVGALLWRRRRARPSSG